MTRVIRLWQEKIVKQEQEQEQEQEEENTKM